MSVKANVLIDQTGNARLADFGLLTIISDPTNLLSSCSYTHGGTTRWMSPELINPQGFGLENSRPTKRSDCYALGMVIYETISGHSPFHKCVDATVLMKVLTGEHPSRGVGFTERLWKMLELCWTPQPKNRPRVADVLLCLEGAPESCSPWEDGEMEEDSNDCDSVNDSSGTFITRPLRCPMVSMYPMVADASTSIDQDSHTARLHSRSFSVIPEPVGPTKKPNTTERNDILGSLVYGNLTPGTSKLPETHSLGASQTMRWGWPPLDSNMGDGSSHGPSWLTFSRQQSHAAVSGPFDSGPPTEEEEVRMEESPIMTVDVATSRPNGPPFTRPDWPTSVRPSGTKFSVTFNDDYPLDQKDQAPQKLEAKLALESLMDFAFTQDVSSFLPLTIQG